MATVNTILRAASSGLMQVIAPKKKPNAQGVTVTPTFNKSNVDNILAIPAYRDHLSDIFTDRTSYDSRELLSKLFITDPDMSAAVNAFLTVADTQPVLIVKDVNNQIDPAGQLILNELVTFLTTRMDYVSQGFKIVKSLNHLAEEMRYMLLLRGAIGGELIMSKLLQPTDIRFVDMGKVEWFEKIPGSFTPRQRALTGDIIDLDIPTFFATFFRQNPFSIYPISPFVSAINTIAARQQVINDLYRIMQVTGFPRMEVTVMEEVLMKNAPNSVTLTPESKIKYLQTQMASLTGQINSIRPDETFVHTDSIKTGMINEKSAANSLNIDSVISALNSQNQAGLRTMATIIGRGESGVNTATVEARVFSMNADALNKPIADFLSQAFTMALRFSGSQSRVEAYFLPVELRSETEQETNKLIRAQRLKADLSLGIISDEEYCLQMYNRLPLVGSTPLSGTHFDDPQSASVDATKISPNSGGLNKGLSAPGGTKPARSNQMGKAKIGSN